MADHISISNAEGTWVVRAGGAVLAESETAIALSEGGGEPVIYFPQSDIAMAFLDASDKTTICSRKGTASYYSIVTKSTTIQNAAWSYEAPKDEAAKIAGYLAFYASDLVTIEQV